MTSRRPATHRLPVGARRARRKLEAASRTGGYGNSATSPYAARLRSITAAPVVAVAVTTAIAARKVYWT